MGIFCMNYIFLPFLPSFLFSFFLSSSPFFLYFSTYIFFFTLEATAPGETLGLIGKETEDNF